jgi:hypothetical protein
LSENKFNCDIIALLQFVEYSLKPLIFCIIAQTAGMTDLQRVWAVTTLVLEGCCLSLGSNDELRMCLKVPTP